MQFNHYIFQREYFAAASLMSELDTPLLIKRPGNVNNIQLGFKSMHLEVIEVLN